ncbi:MAG: aldehyde dehydrogenase family protein [Nanopusillaceae archaeon]
MHINNNKDFKSRYEFLKKFSLNLIKNKIHIAKIASQLSNTNINDNLKDIEFVIKFINNFLLKYQLSKDDYLYVPRGKVLIITPRNEILINTIIPTISAFYVGNTVILKPPREYFKFVKYIAKLLPIPKNHHCSVYVKYFPRSLLKKYIKICDYIFLLTSYRIAKKVIQLCLKYNKEFYYEAEGINDCIIDTSDSSLIRKFIKDLITNISEHRGERCQSIKRIFLFKSNYIIFKKICSEHKNDLILLNSRLKIPYRIEEHKNNTKETNSTVYISRKIYILDNLKKLKNYIEKNKKPLVLYIYSSKPIEFWSKELINKYPYSFVIFNKKPVISPTDPWGGIKQSGLFGPTNWIHKFCYRIYIKK